MKNVDLIAEHALKYFTLSAFILILAYSVAIHTTTKTQGNYGLGDALLYTVFIILATLFFLYIFRTRLWILLFLIEVFTTYIMGVFVFYTLNFPLWLGLLLAVLPVWLRLRGVEGGRDVAVFALVAGAGAFLAVAFPPLFMVAFLGLLLLWDVFSVFISGQMVELAKNAKKRGLLMTVEGRGFHRGKIVGIVMGTGDIVVPAAMSASFLVIGLNVALLFLVASWLGYLLTVWLLKRQTYLPALLTIGGVQLLTFVIWYVMQYGFVLPF